MADKRKNTQKLKMDMDTGDVPFKKYPRPQLIRDSKWICLNGRWDCGVIVPFPLQSTLSDFENLPKYKGEVPEEYDYYTSFSYIPSGDHPHGCRVLLHFGAVDQICDIAIDGVKVGHHEGGYLPFTIDITDSVIKDSAAILSGNEIHGGMEGAHVLQVHVIDRLDLKYPYGKQSKTPGGMWYTPVSGIWQTVWIEEVPDEYIKGIRLTPDLDGVRLIVEGDAQKYTVEVYEAGIGYNPATRIISPREPYYADGSGGDDSYIDPEIRKSLLSRVFKQDKKIPASDMNESENELQRIIYRETYNGNKTYIEIEDPKHWSPDSPFLYGIRVSTDRDSVAAYFALRDIKIKKTGDHKRFLLNGKPIFFHGVLDQGYYPEGIFLPNNEEGYDRDIMYMKELGFNTLRKHIKIEPPAFYVACDIRGMMVWQDMINNSDYDFMRDTILPTFGIKAKTDHLTHRDPQSRQIFEDHMKEEVRYLYNFPCICYYTIFNEGWGQFDSDRLYEELKDIDSTRIVDSTSGWFRQFKSDVVSRHVYFHKVAKIIHHHHPVVISEFGGYNYGEKGHTFNPLSTYGYKSFKDKKLLSESILKLYREDIISYIELGCSGSIYTQLSDVEDETNGFYTYDRQVCKVDKDIMRKISDELRTEFERCVSIK